MEKAETVLILYVMVVAAIGGWMAHDRYMRYQRHLAAIGTDVYQLQRKIAASSSTYAGSNMVKDGCPMPIKGVNTD